jgi:eukaryotic-like serine/threonine-protein kinase
MPMTPDTRFGPYEVVELLGSGGMGEVYRARDSRLRRDVALKILPAHHQVDADRRARFEREALALGALNHPNIATIHGVEEAGGIRALVMELVDGETLADRLTLDTKLSFAETTAIARQIVDALDAAHERGVIHRDLKPSNIKIRLDGTVKVLDFGLAKALENGSHGAGIGADTKSLTAAQTVVGTPAYMSPEQTRGLDVDRRTDIWAFGCVLYEMLAGRPAFEGSTSSDVIAAVLERDPNYDRLPADTPLLIRRLLKRCLEKDQRRRLRDIADARIDLDEAASSSGVAPASGAAFGRRSRAAGLWLAIAIAGVVVAAAGLTVTSWRQPRDEASPQPVHMTALLPPGVSVTRGPGKLLSLALSPDGRTLVIAGTDASGERLYRRTLDGPEATPIAGTEAGSVPFFSPDGTWVGFFADRRLKRVPIAGGSAIDVAAAPGFPAGASWSVDDRIVFAGYQAPLQIVDARSGATESLLPRGADLGHVFPEFLPDGRTVLFSESGWIHAIDVVSKRRTDRIVRGTGPRYSSAGHLVLTRGSTLLAAPFDVSSLKLLGPEMSAIEGVDVEWTTNGAAHVALSRAGTLAYVPSARTFALVLVEPGGTERVLAEHAMVENPRFSPDGRRLVVAAVRKLGEAIELWMHDLQTARPAYRLTSDGGRAPVWTRDGASVTYSVPRVLAPGGSTGRFGERPGIYTTSPNGQGDTRQIVSLPNFNWLVGWAPKQTLLYGMMETTPGEAMPLSSIFALEGSESRRLVGPGSTWGGRLSPDGRWLVYYSRDSGYFEIYVTPFPNTGPRTLIAEGTDPAWSPNGSEIYYRSGSRLMAAHVDISSGVRVTSRRLVFEPFLPPLYDDYDIHPDGRTLALVGPAGESRGREITVVLNWPAELSRLARPAPTTR